MAESHMTENTLYTLLNISSVHGFPSFTVKSESVLTHSNTNFIRVLTTRNLLFREKYPEQAEKIQSLTLDAVFVGIICEGTIGNTQFPSCLHKGQVNSPFLGLYGAG